MVSNAEKLEELDDFFHILINSIQDKLRTEHLVQDKTLFVLYFRNFFKSRLQQDEKPDPSKLSVKELIEGYRRALELEGEEEKESLATYLVTTWVIQNEPVYRLFEEKLKEINENLEEIMCVCLEDSKRIIDASISQFGCISTYLFVVLNSVCIESSCLESLRKMALDRKKSEEFQLGLDKYGLYSDLGGVPVPKRKGRKSTPSTLTPHSHILSRQGVGRLSAESKQRMTPFPGSSPLAPSPIIALRASSSFVVPRSNEDYEKIFKSTTMEGYLEKKSSGSNKQWKRRWVVLKDAKIYYYKNKSSLSSSPNSPLLVSSPQAPDGCIPLYLVRSIRSVANQPSSDNNAPKTVLAIDTISRLFYFRAPSEETAHQWLFCFQCSLALNLDSMLTAAMKEKRQKVLEISRWWKKSKMIEKLLMSSSRGPILHIDSYSEQSPSSEVPFTCAWAATIGHRPTMEDAHCVVTNVNRKFDLECSHSQSFFGVFDGHGGQEASLYTSDHLLENIVHNDLFLSNNSDDIKRAITDAFLKTDNDFTMVAETDELYSGTTAITALLRGNRLFVANCGDSRAVLCRDGVAIPLSVDHKPNREDEKERITNAGGWIQTHKELNLAQLYRLNPEFIDEMEIPQRLAAVVGLITIHRVLGELSVTRAIGDREYKGTLKNEFWDKEFTEDIIISLPEIHEVEITDKDEFLLLACDGLWDVFENQHAIDFVKLNHGSDKEIASNLVNEAIKLGSMDNVSVLLVFFKPQNLPELPQIRIDEVSL